MALDTYNPYEMLGTNSPQKITRMSRIEVHEIDSSIEMSIQLVELTKQVALLATRAFEREKYLIIMGMVLAQTLMKENNF